jgi:methionyl aminopeptidase
MIVYKTPEEIELIRQSNILVSKTLAEVAKLIKPSVKTVMLDKCAEEFIRDNKAIPGFLGYNNFPKTLCTSVNSQVVHGIPGDIELKEGDIISIDCGVLLNGYYGDAAYTFAVGEISQEVYKLLQITKQSLFLGIEQAVEGKRIGDISHTIQNYCETAGFSVVREMVGHGLGKHLHEAPEVPNYGKKGTGALLKTGMVLCIEPMINMGHKRVYQEKDGWTIRTADNKPSAHFEHAIAIGKNKADVLSTYSYLKEVLGEKEF